MSNKKILHLTLKKKWFDMIASGEKKEEYREIKPYWIKRLCAWNNAFNAVKFTNGYGRNSPTMTFTYERIKIGKGKEEWGAEPNKEYFVIPIGNLIIV